MRVTDFTRRVPVAVVLVCIAAQTLAAEPPAGPHGEGGKITRVNGEDYISYTYIEAPGATGTPAVFKVFRPRSDPPDGLQKPRLSATDVGSWVFIGEGNLASISAMMDLDANGFVTWTFMSIANLEKYRPAASAASAQVVAAPAAAPYGHDPNFPEQEHAYLLLALNDFDVDYLSYAYSSGPNERPEINLSFHEAGGGALLNYLGFNDQGTWLTGNGRDAKRLYTFRGDIHTPITGQRSGGQCNGNGACVSDGQLIRQPYSTPVPKDLRNMPADVRANFANYDREFGHGPTAAEEAAQNDRGKQLFDLDAQAKNIEPGIGNLIARVDRDKYRFFGREINAWRDRRAQECGPIPVSEYQPMAVKGVMLAPARDTAVFNCMMAKTRDRIALYERAEAELTAGKVSQETWLALGLLNGDGGNGSAPAVQVAPAAPATQGVRPNARNSSQRSISK